MSYEGAQLKMYDETLEPVAQTFLSAGSGDFLVPSFLRPNSTELESSVSPQTGMSALRALAPGQMSEILPVVYLVRHGETAWSLKGQHTGLTNLPLTERGKRNARRLGERMAGLAFAKVLTSPLQRAARTCEPAGFGAAAEVDRDLIQLNYV